MPALRQPRPRFQQTLTATIQPTASIVRKKVSETVERSGPWYVVLVVLMVAGALIGPLVPLGAVGGVAAGIALGVVGILLGPRAERRLRRETEYVDDG